jgi:hypothetical protein
MVLGTVGIRMRAMTSEAMKKATIYIIDAGLHMVVDKVIMPVVFSRKWPGVATSRGALEESPYCHME